MRIKITNSKNSIHYSIIQDIVKNGKRTTKVYENIGNLNSLKQRAGTEDPIIWLQNYVDNLNNKTKNKSLPIIIEKYENRIIEKDIQNSFNIGYLFLKNIYYSLKLDKICEKITNKYQFKFDLNSILSNLIYARIIYPSSKLKTLELCHNFYERPNFDYNNILRALEIISKESDYIQSQLYINSNKIFKRNNKILYYDCTNFFFEIEQEDELRKYGKSKENRPNPIVQMGLFMDGNGLPLSYNIYPGNMNEQKTLIPEENKIINKFKLNNTKLILCTDAGLASDEIKKYNIKNGRGFVITQSLKKLKEEYKSQIFDKTNWRISNDLKHIYNLNDIEDNDELKEKYYDTLFYKIIQTETKSVKQDLIVTFSFKYQEYNRNIRSSQIDRAKKSIDTNNVTRKGKNQNDYRRFIETTSVTNNGEVAENTEYTINESLINEESKYDGYYAITTNLIGEINDILKITKGRWEIEESFRIMKSDFLARPINLSREDRIKAHFMTCFISLLLYRILESKLENKYTTSQILNTLRKMTMLEQKGLGFEPEYERTNLTDDLHNIFNFNTDMEIVNYKKMKKILNTK